jgi:hypothetical protein
MSIGLLLDNEETALRRAGSSQGHGRRACFFSRLEQSDEELQASNDDASDAMAGALDRCR